MADAKQEFVSGHRERESSANNAEYGTKASGFATDGPFSCKNCVHKMSTRGVAICTHPKVNDDPQLRQRARGQNGYVIVDADDCCRYVRPTK